MLESHTFYAETMSILEIVMEAAVDFTSILNTPRRLSPVDLSDILQRLAKEAARQINTLFIRITVPMWNENNSLKIKVKQLDTDVKTTEQHLDVAQKWRDSVLRGSPVLFEQSGQIFILTPFEKLKDIKHKRTAGSVHATLPTVQSAASHPRPSMAPMVVVNKVPSVPTLLLAEGGRVVTKAPALPAAMTTPVTTPPGAKRKKPRGKNTSKRVRTEKEKLVRGPAEMQMTHKWQESKAARSFFCKVCSAGFHWRADLLSHTKVHVKLQQEKKMYRPQIPTLQTPLEMEPRIDKDISESDVTAAGDSDTADLGKRHERNLKNRALRTVKRFFCSVCHVGFHWRADLHRHAKVHKKPFQCPHCPRGYLMETLLENHVLRHHRQPLPFGCDRCGRKFRLQPSLQRHLARHETSGQAAAALACDRCGKLFKGEVSLQNHLRRHEADTEGFQCQICEKVFRTAALARCHRVVHSEERPFKCPLCARAFKSRSCLRFHQTVHSDRRRHRCGMCDRSFRYAYSLTVHVRGHTGEAPYGCDVCGKSFAAAASLRKHRVVHTGEKPFTCHVCGAMFGLGANLRRHLRIHTGEKRYECTDCHERFADSNRLKAHMLLHGATKQFMCDLCGKTFLFNCKLLKHQQAAHGGHRTSESAGEGRAWRKTPTNPFRCGICLKGFASASYLRIHEKAHDGQRPYGCGVCNKSFSNKYALGSHEKTHSDEKPYGCGACGKSFKAASSLRLHERTHNGEKPYGCEQCGKAFSCSGNLQRHQKVHTGEKPYECEQCHRRFSQSNQIKLHMQIHTGVKLYQCDKCGRGFSDSRQYKKHGCEFNVAAMQQWGSPGCQ